jgi:hypothetical protein
MAPILAQGCVFYIGSVRHLLALAILVQMPMWAQLTTGTLAGTLRAPDGHILAGESVLITGPARFHITVRTDSKGAFAVTLPYGRYRLPWGDTVFVAPLQTTNIDVSPSAPATGYPEGFSLAGLLMSREVSTVTQPLDFTGENDNRLAVESQRGFSWTETQFKLQGMDATDSYQPGFPLIFPDVGAVDQVVVRSESSQVDVFLTEARGAWHGSISTSDTGSPLSSSNLPQPADRGSIQQAQQFQWFTRDRADVGGPLTKWADIYASGSGQWASQAEPLDAPGTDQRSRLPFGNARGQVRAGASDLIDALYSGSRIDLSDGGVPAGIEALAGNRMMPSFVLPGGFQGQSEVDHLDFVQAGWTHLFPTASGLGTIEARYQYSAAHLDTSTPSLGESIIELVGGAVSGAPPLANLAVRTRHQIAAAWQPAPLHFGGVRHQIVAGGGWKTSQPRNRFRAPSDMNLITADGAPAFVAELNTPADSRELVQSFSAYAADHITLGSISVDVGALADFSRGSLAAQSSAAGFFAPARTFAPQSDLIVWNNVAPRAGFAWRIPHAHGFTLRASYLRLDVPLAGRYLDYGNPNSLGGNVYKWITSDVSAPFEPSQVGALLSRFGGPYSSISPSLERPYSDTFDIGAEMPFAHRSTAGIHLFRRDDRNRLAAIDTGVPAAAFTPVSILDPGPDGIPATFDDRQLTVYAQNAATLGQDRYLLTNPPGLSERNEGLLAEAATEWRGLALHASFLAEKSYGPTNAGDAFYQNDPGVVGALFLDPNTLIYAAGQSFVDRAFVGKAQASYRLPSGWSGIEIVTVADYMDGLPFARQLLVTGLPQGPFLLATTPRGSVGGGNRSQYVINWNLRLSREFTLPSGTLAVKADMLNVSNAAQRPQEDDVSGPAFNMRLPVAIEAPRLVRIGVGYRF